MRPLRFQDAPRDEAPSVVIERDRWVTRVVVPMQGPYAPVPRWVCDLWYFPPAAAPCWWLGTLIIRTCLRVPKPPRVVFEVSRERVTVCVTDPDFDETTSFAWPRSAVAEARGQGYDRALWLNVPGRLKATRLADLSRETIERIEAALRSFVVKVGVHPDILWCLNREAAANRVSALGGRRLAALTSPARVGEHRSARIVGPGGVNPALPAASAAREKHSCQPGQ